MNAVNPTAGIILAAGASTRLGQPKQLLRLQSKYLLEWVLESAVNSRLEKIILVLGYAYQTIMQVLGAKLEHAKLRVVVNRHYQKGQSQSLRLGLSKVKNDFAAVMFLLGDQPLLNSATIDMLLERFWAADQDACVPVYRGKRKTPAIFGRRFYAQLMEITGDQGARKILADHADRVLTVEINDPLCFWDVDTTQDLENLKRKLKP